MLPSLVAQSEIASVRIPIPSRSQAQREETADTTFTRSEAKAAAAATWTFQGYSRAGIATSFVLQEPKWIWDAGCIVTPHRPSCIFITHTHADHIQALPQLLFAQRYEDRISTIQVYFPAPSETPLRSFLQSYHTLIRDDEDVGDMEVKYHFRLFPVSVGEEWVLPNTTNKIQYLVRVVECDHRKVCYGYSLFQRHWIVSAPFHRLSGLELGAVLRSGQTVPHEWSRPQPLLCYLGDSTTQVFSRHPELLQQHRVIALESTYYRGSVADEAENAAKHTYWPVLQKNVIEQHPQISFLLQHFSLRHRTREWIQWIQEYNQSSSSSSRSGHANVHALLPNADCLCVLCQPRNHDED